MKKALVFICLLLSTGVARAEDRDRPGPMTGPVLAAGDISGEPGAQIALRIEAPNAPPGAKVAIFKLPEGAELSIGVGLGQGYWLTSADALAGVSITSPALPLRLSACLVDSRLRRLTGDVRFAVTRAATTAPASFQTIANRN